MEIKLSQKEKMLLEDDKQQEEICITKYQSYAKQASDPELQQLLSKISKDEQHHYNMVDQLLQGKQPSIMNQDETETKQKKPLSEISQMKSVSNVTDKVLCSDLLSTEKYVSSTYDTGIFESANPVVRQTLQHIQKEEQHHGEQLFHYMHSHGMYSVK